VTDRVRLAGLAKRFGPVVAVFPTDLSVKQGEFVVLLGPSGSGKTTTLRMIAGLEQPSQGQVFLSDNDVTSLSPADRDVAFVFQLFSLYPHLSVIENVAFPLRAAGMAPSDAARRAADMLARLGLETLASAMPRRLSGGAQQRVGLARALVRKPQAFLMDEPLGTLDGSLRARMRETLRAIHNESGATTIFVTHDQEEALSISDRIAVMYGGRIVETGELRQIVRTPRHPYTRGLLHSTVHGGQRGQRLQAIPGAPPRLDRLPEGCSFAPRCGFAAPACGHDEIPLVALDAGHSARCLKTAELA
jgi:oligopeptide/dipeptide ABC transporter ATP-binding protein